ncbi:MAG: RNA-binding S4 domain-containing protein [Clostridiales bacterium]|jgi:ribosomal 50S subunit-recycling heat shock protein|nr:RNA-binding S4 domain-containing protein [Clostridiales bacterium]
MRLDKFLKVSRIIKRRTIAKDAADSGRICVNDKVAKAGTDVSPGDIIEIKFGTNVLKAKVVATPEFTKKDEAASMYEVID